MLEALRRYMAPLARRIRLMVSIGVLDSSNDAGNLQTCKVRVLNNEVRDGANRLQNYGFSSRPLAGAQVVTLEVGGSRNHLVVIAADDGRHRPKALEEGECVMYSDEGDYIKLKRGRIIEVVAGAQLNVTAPQVVVTASEKVTLATPLVECAGDLVVAGEATIGGIAFSTHTHPGVMPGGASTGVPQ